MDCIFPQKHLVIGIKEISESAFHPVRNECNFVKPKGGLWASTFLYNDKYLSYWHEWCASEMPEYLSNDSVIIEIKDDAKVFTINSQDDLIRLIEIVGEQENEMQRLGLCLSNIPDYEKASEIFDIIYLTTDGQWATRMPRLNSRYNLYGWDCECILVMNLDCIKSWEYKKLDIAKETKALA